MGTPTALAAIVVFLPAPDVTRPLAWNALWQYFKRIRQPGGALDGGACPEPSGQVYLMSELARKPSLAL
jgi:hypothetical protein